MSDLLKQFLESNLSAKDFLNSIKKEAEENPRIANLKRDMLQIDQRIADIEIRKLKADDDEIESLDDEIADLKADKEDIKADIENIKDNESYIHNKKIDSIIEMLLQKNNFILNESFQYNDLSAIEQKKVYDAFKKAYEKATGAAWDERHFVSRAYNWSFFGTIEGGVAVRKQRSGLNKLVATYGSPKNVINGYHQMEKEIGHEPIWGAMTLNLAQMLEKISNKDFKLAPKLFVKNVIPHIKHIFGDVVKDFTKDGGILIDTPAGTMTKYFIANKKYYYQILDMAQNNSDKLPIPKPIIKIITPILRRFI